MNDRVMIWMSREDCLAVKQLLEERAQVDLPPSPFVEGTYPLDRLYEALEDAYRNNANWEPSE